MGFVPAGSFAVAGPAAVAGTHWALIAPGAAIVACGAAARAHRQTAPEAPAVRSVTEALAVTLARLAQRVDDSPKAGNLAGVRGGLLVGR